MTTEYIITLDEEKCVGCHACVVACKVWREIPLGLGWRRINRLWSGKFPNVRLQHASINCQHCVEPACAAACPTSSIKKNTSDGRVLVDRATCIGCEACAEACPFAVPAFGADGTMQKCDLCIENVDVKQDAPHCVATCPTGALTLKKLEPNNKLKYEAKLVALLDHASAELANATK